MNPAPPVPAASRRALSLALIPALLAFALLCAPARAADTPTTTTSASQPPRNGAKTEKSPFDLGAFGESFRWSVYPTAKGVDTSSIVFDEETGTLAEITLIGIVHIESDKVRLDCENLVYDGGRNLLTARYNVVLEYAENDLQARCGQLVYDLNTEEMSLTVKPEVTARGGTLRDDNMIVLKRLANGKVAISTKSATTGSVGELGGPPQPETRRDDTPTTTAPQEITPGAASRSPRATPTPGASNGPK